MSRWEKGFPHEFDPVRQPELHRASLEMAEVMRRFWDGDPEEVMDVSEEAIDAAVNRAIRDYALIMMGLDEHDQWRMLDPPSESGVVGTGKPFECEKAIQKSEVGDTSK
jgi:hypothetical protein